MKQLTQLILFIFLFQFQANAQFWKKAKEVVENVGDKISLKSLQSGPVSTSFSDVDRQNTMSISFGADANRSPLSLADIIAARYEQRPGILKLNDGESKVAISYSFEKINN